VRIDGLDGSWTSKLVVIACNDWDNTQASWLQAALSIPTTFTLVARHQPTGATAPCVDASERLLSQAKYDLLLTGHVRTFGSKGKTLIVGNGGAPISGNEPYGFATVEQQASGFMVTQYEYESGAPVGSFLIAR
jgi:hypothetical protein